jgi:hypothetical protein
MEIQDMALTYCSVTFRSLLPVPILYWQRGPILDAFGSIIATIKVLREIAIAALRNDVLGESTARTARPTMVETDKGSPSDISAQRGRSSSYTERSIRSGVTSVSWNSTEHGVDSESGVVPRTPDASRAALGARSPSTGSSRKSGRSSMSGITSDSDSHYGSRSHLCAKSGLLADHDRILPNRLCEDYGGEISPTEILARTAGHDTALKAEGTDELGYIPSMGIVTDGMFFEFCRYQRSCVTTFSRVELFR